ncbi:MAG: 4Fe-4S binding protein [Oscillospiraceae bacterium]|jgi:carbon-monoxide dehydrogenase iron sulfur subunit|nr:4Fe-4S binding protein [Oscillospiraceae bacterium]
MKKIYVKEEHCLGCHLCETYCAAANSADGKNGERNYLVKAFSRAETPVSRVRIESETADSKGVNFAVQCRHCEVPLCVKGCITGALSVTDGVVSVDDTRCVGCYTCVLTCPYGCIVIPPENGDGATNGKRHIIKKCDLCVSRGATPACVEGCPNGAIVVEERA